MWRDNCVNIFIWFLFSHPLFAFLQHSTLQLFLSLKVNFVERRSKDILVLSFSPINFLPKRNHLLSFVSVEGNNSLFSKGWQGFRDEDWEEVEDTEKLYVKLKFYFFFFFSYLAFCFHRDEKCYTSDDVFLPHDASILKINKTSSLLPSPAATLLAIRLLPFYRASLLLVFPTQSDEFSSLVRILQPRTFIRV